MSLGVKLRRIRHEKNWSQAEVADKLNISQPAYHLWETDQAKPAADNLFRLANIFKIDVYDLFENAVNDFSNGKFEGTNIIANTNPVINFQSSNLLQNVLKNQEQITKLLETQNKLIEGLLKKD